MRKVEDRVELSKVVMYLRFAPGQRPKAGYCFLLQAMAGHISVGIRDASSIQQRRKA